MDIAFDDFLFPNFELDTSTARADIMRHDVIHAFACWTRTW